MQGRREAPNLCREDGFKERERGRVVGRVEGQFRALVPIAGRQSAVGHPRVAGVAHGRHVHGADLASVVVVLVRMIILVGVVVATGSTATATARRIRMRFVVVESAAAIARGRAVGIHRAGSTAAGFVSRGLFFQESRQRWISGGCDGMLIVIESAINGVDVGGGVWILLLVVWRGKRGMAVVVAIVDIVQCRKVCKGQIFGTDKVWHVTGRRLFFPELLWRRRRQRRPSGREFRGRRLDGTDRSRTVRRCTVAVACTGSSNRDAHHGLFHNNELVVVFLLARQHYFWGRQSCVFVPFRTRRRLPMWMLRLLRIRIANWLENGGTHDGLRAGWLAGWLAGWPRTTSSYRSFVRSRAILPYRLPYRYRY